MAGRLTLEPFAAELRWQTTEPSTGEQWKALLGEFVALLARGAADAGATLIGHIKALATGSGDGFVHASAVSAAHPPALQGELPDGLREVSVRLNVLVYGLPRAVVEDLVRRTAARGRGGSCDVAVAPALSAARFEHLHPRDPRKPNGRTP